MPIATIAQLCAPSAVATSDGLVEQVAQIEALAVDEIDGRRFFRPNFFADGLNLLVRRCADRLVGRLGNGAFYPTQATGGGKTLRLVALSRLQGRSSTVNAQGQQRGSDAADI